MLNNLLGIVCPVQSNADVIEFLWALAQMVPIMCVLLYLLFVATEFVARHAQTFPMFTMNDRKYPMSFLNVEFNHTFGKDTENLYRS